MVLEKNLNSSRFTAYYNLHAQCIHFFDEIDCFELLTHCLIT